MSLIKERLEADLSKAAKELEKERYFHQATQREKDSLTSKLNEVNKNLRESCEQVLLKERTLEKALDEAEGLRRELAEAKADIHKKETLYTDTFNDFSVLKEESVKLERRLEAYAQQSSSVEGCSEAIQKMSALGRSVSAVWVSALPNAKPPWDWLPAAAMRSASPPQ